MKKFTGILFHLCAVFLLSTIVGFGFETDQYNLPPNPLADIGDEVSQYTKENIGEAVDKLNAQIEFSQNCIERNSKKIKKYKCESLEKERLKLAYLRSEEAITRAVFRELGSGIPPFTSSEMWINSHKFIGHPARYQTDYSKSIFALNPFII